MKRQLILIAAALLCTVVSFGQAKFDNWPAMKDFHNSLAHAFHPAEEGDMKPIRSTSHELFAKCKVLNVSPIPGEYDNEKMRKTLKRMEKETDKLNALVVRQEQNATIMTQLNVVHSTFHDIVGMCKKEEPGQTSK